MIPLEPFPSDGEIMALAQKVVEAAEKAIAEERKKYQWPGSEPGTHIAEIVQLIPARFRFFTERDPRDLDLLFSSLDFIIDGLRTGTAGKDTAIADLLRDWDGNARTNFGTGFIHKIAPVSRLQIDVAVELQAELSAYRQLLVAGRNDIITIGNTTVELLEEIEATSKLGDAYRLSVLGTIIGILGAARTGWGAIGVAVAGGVPTIWGTTLREFEKPWVEGDASVQETLNSMEDQIFSLKAGLNRREEQLAAEADEARKHILDQDWVLATARDPNATRLTDDDRAMVLPAPELVSYESGDPIDFTWEND